MFSYTCDGYACNRDQGDDALPYDVCGRFRFGWGEYIYMGVRRYAQTMERGIGQKWVTTEQSEDGGLVIWVWKWSGQKWK